MKVVQISHYGGPEVLEINENAPKPTPQKGQLLIEVHASSINALDWKLRAGNLKDMVPLQLPITPGEDFAGIVAEQLGDDVSNFKVGDEVYGQADALFKGGTGTFAEFVCTDLTHVALKPKSISLVE